MRHDSDKSSKPAYLQTLTHFDSCHDITIKIRTWFESRPEFGSWTYDAVKKCVAHDPVHTRMFWLSLLLLRLVRWGAKNYWWCQGLQNVIICRSFLQRNLWASFMIPTLGAKLLLTRCARVLLLLRLMKAWNVHTITPFPIQGIGNDIRRSPSFPPPLDRSWWRKDTE